MPEAARPPQTPARRRGPEMAPRERRGVPTLRAAAVRGGCGAARQGARLPVKNAWMAMRGSRCATTSTCQAAGAHGALSVVEGNHKGSPVRDGLCRWVRAAANAALSRSALGNPRAPAPRPPGRAARRALGGWAGAFRTHRRGLRLDFENDGLQPHRLRRRAPLRTKPLADARACYSGGPRWRWGGGGLRRTRSLKLSPPRKRKVSGSFCSAANVSGMFSSMSLAAARAEQAG